MIGETHTAVRRLGRGAVPTGLVISACLLLATCAAPPDEASPDADPPAAVGSSHETDLPASLEEGEAPLPVDGAPNETVAAQEFEEIEEEVDELAAVPTEIPRVPEGLTGLDESDLTEFLGVPSFVRRDGAAQIWQYRNDGCALDLFLYPEGSSASAKVTHVETRSLTVVPVAAASCYHELLKARYATDAG